MCVHVCVCVQYQHVSNLLCVKLYFLQNFVRKNKSRANQYDQFRKMEANEETKNFVPPQSHVALLNDHSEEKDC